MPSRIAKASKGLVVDIQIDHTGENEATRQREWDPSAFSAAAKSASPVTQVGVAQACKRASRSLYFYSSKGVSRPSTADQRTRFAVRRRITNSKPMARTMAAGRSPVRA